MFYASHAIISSELLLLLSVPFSTEIQAFDGLAPEVINSRLSMLGFAIAAFFELTQGLDVFQQIKTYPLLTIATFVIFTTASWIPFLQGQSYNVKSGPFTPAVSLNKGCVAVICSDAVWLGKNCTLSKVEVLEV
jgi:hypothetical protein